MSRVREVTSRPAGKTDSAAEPAKPAGPPRIVGSDVHARLVEAEETLRAIRSGEVDALVLHDSSPDPQVFTLSSADRPYRMFVENMRDGAATLSESGIVLYANRSLAALVARPLAQLIGSPVTSLIADEDITALEAISGRTGGTIEANLATSRGERVPVRITTSTLDVDAQAVLCVTFADLTQQTAHKLEIDRLQASRVLELEQAQDTLTQQATHDALTGLGNRTLLIDRIILALGLAERSEDSIGLIFVDLDDFKGVNDTRGHAAGDAVLCEVAQRLQNAVRPMDSVSRLGGDEFIVLLPALTTPDDALNVAQRIASEIDPPIKLSRGSVSVTASIGIAVGDPADHEGERTATRLIHQADAAMYHAKSLGGSQAELFQPGITPTGYDADLETWGARIHEALDKDHFVLHAQPIVDLATGATVQHELLLRLRDRGERLIAPMTFLPTAERCGLIGEIDQWVIRQAAQIAAHGQPVAVNLSAASAADPEVLELIESELRKRGTDPSNFMFEITETAVMQNMGRGRRFAERMVALGCSFALDDFGTGYGSFTYLKHFPAKYLKIDIEFVRDLLHSQRDRSVVSAIVALAAGFGQQTIAEGVEDQETASVLRDLGVTFGQGYLFGRPAPFAAAARISAALIRR
jgi:diguanylate cyclase (GGDEF)-like protein/PAS domain S-box-containing protein